MKSTLKGLLVMLVISFFSLSVSAQLPTNWSYGITANNHVLLLQSTTIIHIDGLAAPTTDCWVGVFYDNTSGGLNCGGYTAWQGTTTNITAWGVDVGDDGFASGEEFKWKIYANGLEYDAVATYMPVMPLSTFTVNGMSGILTLNAASVINVEAVAWLSPLTSCGLGADEIVTVSFRNDTLGNITDPFFIKYSIDGGTNWVTETYTLGISPMDTAVYSFTQTADFSAFANVGGNIADTTYSVMFEIVFSSDMDSTDNLVSATVTNMVPPFTELSGLDPSYCLYSNIAPVILTGTPSGGTYSGTGVQGNTFLMGNQGYPFAGPGTHCIVYSFYDVNTGCDGIDTFCVEVNAVPIATIGGYSSLNTCQYDTIPLLGSPAGGTFLGTPFINPTTGEFNPLISGNFDLTYAYTDGNGCADTSDIYTFTTYPLPTVTIDNLSRAYCASQSQIVLNGNPSGGTFFIDNSAIPSNIFDPNTVSASVHNIGYIYTDLNGCTDDFGVNVKVFPLPNVTYTGLDMEYCQHDDSVGLVGSPANGVWTGTSTDNWFSPVDDGVFSVVYSFTQAYQYYGDTALCENIDTHFTTVFSLPVIDIATTFPLLPNGDVETSVPDTVELDPGSGFNSYEWNTSATTQIINADYDWGYLVNGYGGYSLTVTDFHGCEGIDSLFVGGTDIKIGELINPVSNCTLEDDEDIIVSYINNGTHTFLSGDKITFSSNINDVNTISVLRVLATDFAPGDTLEFTFTTPLTNIHILENVGSYNIYTGLNYQNGLEIPDINLTNDTMHTVVINGGLPVVDLGVDFSTLLPDTVILDAGPFSSFVWNTGENTQTITIDILTMTEYCVTITDQFGCNAEDCITIIDIDELPTSFDNINLYPNPNNGQFTLLVENKSYADIKYELVDVKGNIILSETKFGVNLLREDIQIQGMAKGIYFMKINNGSDVNVIKIAIE